MIHSSHIQTNQHGSLNIYLGLVLFILFGICAGSILSSNINSKRSQIASANRDSTFSDNELSALHSRVLQENGMTSCPSGADNSGRCLMSTDTDKKKFWVEQMSVGAKNCGSTAAGGNRTRTCIVDWDPCKKLPIKKVNKADMSDPKNHFTFEENNKTCPWGTKPWPNADATGNLNRKNNHTNSRVEDARLSLTDENGAPLPENAYLCKFKFNFNYDTFNFTDGVMLTFDDIILISSDNWTERAAYQGSNGYLIYDWEKIRGTEVGVKNADSTENIEATGKFRNGYGTCKADPKTGIVPLDCSTYCLGMDDPEYPSACNMPAKSQLGGVKIDGLFQLEINNPGIFDLLARVARQQKRHDFQLITYGDDDSYDCTHGKLKFGVEYEYVELPNVQ